MITINKMVNAGIGTNTAVYAYDEIGNQTYNAVNSLQTAYTANNLNQYSQISAPSASSAVNPTYDSDGNLLSDGLFTYAWDGENRLAAIYSNTTCIVSNAYDHAHRRILKITPSATHTFIYDGWNLVQETIATATGVSTNRYIWGKDLSDSLQGAGGVGGLLAVVQSGMGFQPVVFLPLYDSNGNITAYADESGNIVAEYTYDAFGRTFAATGPLAGTFPHRFSTKYYDSETGLYYYGYRFYSPELMRWLNRDPIEERGGLQAYAFVENAPNHYIDPLGLATVELIKQAHLKDEPMSIRFHVLPQNIAEGCELNFIQIAFDRGYRRWRVDAKMNSGMPPPNPPFYYDRTWRGHDGRGIDDSHLNPDGSLIFEDQPTVETYFYLFAVERCCTKYYNSRVKSSRVFKTIPGTSTISFFA